MSATAKIRGLRSRTSTYSVLLGTVVAVLVVGLALPLLFGSSSEDRPVAAGGADFDFDAGGRASNPEGSATETTAAGQSLADGAGPAAAPGVAGTTATSQRPGASAGLDASSGPVDNGGATDIGVTGDSIKVAVLIGDAAAVEEAGFGGEASLTNKQARDTFIR